MGCSALPRDIGPGGGHPLTNTEAWGVLGPHPLGGLHEFSHQLVASVPLLLRLLRGSGCYRPVLIPAAISSQDVPLSAPALHQIKTQIF